jgi:hypothetical protein
MIMAELDQGKNNGVVSGIPVDLHPALALISLVIEIALQPKAPSPPLRVLGKAINWSRKVQGKCR